MTTVVADISVSLDGFVTGPDAGPANGLGTGGESLHTWVLDSDDPLNAEILAHSTERSGAVVMGRNLFDVIDAPSGWSDKMVDAVRRELVQREVRPSRTAVHLTYDVR
jgi:dihydrofolate reductase